MENLVNASANYIYIYIYIYTDDMGRVLLFVMCTCVCSTPGYFRKKYWLVLNYTVETNLFVFFINHLKYTVRSLLQTLVHFIHTPTDMVYLVAFELSCGA